MNREYIANKIKDFLESHPNMSFNGSQLARKLGLPYNEANGILRSLSSQNTPWLHKTDTKAKTPILTASIKKHHPELARRMREIKQQHKGRNRPRYQWSGP